MVPNMIYLTVVRMSDILFDVSRNIPAYIYCSRVNKPYIMNLFARFVKKEKWGICVRLLSSTNSHLIKKNSGFPDS